MQKINFNSDWEFTNIDVETNKDLKPSMTVFAPVQLPHDYTADNAFDKSNASSHQGGYVRTGTLWYRKFFELSNLSADTKRFLLFDGVYSNATIYINGKEVYQREYGYISFCVDISDYLCEGVNIVAVKVDGSKEPSTRWFNGQGITRNVWLMLGGETFINNDGVYIKYAKTSEQEVSVAVETKFTNLAKKQVQVCVELLDNQKNVVAKNIVDVCAEIGENTNTQTLLLKNPKLWNIQTPNLYSCNVSITDNADTGLDNLSTNFGVRYTEFIPNKGFYLNGEHTLIKGVCMHHDAGCVGAAVPKALWHKRILQLKEMGCNAIRTSHNPFNPEFYDLCDELGVMVMDEIFDGWELPKVKFGYSTIWEKCHVQDLTDFVIRDRNHPSVILWSIGNEVLNMSTDITKELMGIIRSLDDTRKITAGVQSANVVSDANRALLDVAGYNDGGGACFIYELDHEKRPEQLFIATEAPHSFQTRGFYRTQTWWRDKNQPRQEIDNLTKEEIFFDQSEHYNSSYDNSGVRTCARDSWSYVENLPYLCGEFRWTGYDYVGEAFPYTWPSKTHSFGVIDTANFEKDHYYLYQSMWKTEKMLHVLPHWTHTYMPKGTQVPVWVYTNMQEVELFLNGASLGKKVKGESKNLEWLVPYEEGELVAKAYENNEVVLEKHVYTAKTPCDIELEVDVLPKENISDKQIAQLNFTVIDEHNHVVPCANSLAMIHLPKTVKLLGSDNGAIDDLSHFKSEMRRAFNSKGMYLLQYDENQSESYCVLSAILGDNYFDELTKITLSAKGVALNSKTVCKDNLSIYYTLDGSVADKNSTKFETAICINKTTVINMSVYEDDICISRLSEVFIKGRPEPVVDLTHLNYEVECEKPNGPFDDKIVGLWDYNQCVYSFEADGLVNRKLGKVKSKIGYWWYDFPSDFLETPDYAGTGEIWLVSGERVPISLQSQKADVLNIDNSKNVMGNIYVNVDEISLKKCD